MTTAAGDASRRGGERRKRKEEGGRDRGQEGIGDGWELFQRRVFPCPRSAMRFPARALGKNFRGARPQREAARLAEGTGAREKVTEGGRPFLGSRPRDTHCGWP